MSPSPAVCDPTVIDRSSIVSELGFLEKLLCRLPTLCFDVPVCGSSFVTFLGTEDVQHVL